jgi:hypothetical protein
VSAVGFTLRSGGTFYTKDYDTVDEVVAALKRNETLTVFWFAIYGRRFTEDMCVDWEDVNYVATERDAP